MTIYVTTVDGNATGYGSGTGWHIDDVGDLHIRGTSGNVATIHRTHWVSVSRATA